MREAEEISCRGSNRILLMNPRQFLLESDRFMTGQATPACLTSDSILRRDREGQVADRKVCLLDRHCLLEQHRCTRLHNVILRPV